MNFYRTSIHFQNSSKSITLLVPAFLFNAWSVLRFFVAIGVLLFVVQLVSTTIYESVLTHQLNERANLDKEMSQVQGTLDYLNNTAASFLADENRLYARLGLPEQDYFARNLSTGGSISPDSLLLRKSSPVFDKVARLNETSERIRNKLANNSESFIHLDKFMSQKYSMWHNIPSISPTQGRYASAFGPRIHPVTGEIGKMHQGVDIANERWTPIYASADGLVEIAQLSSSFGNFVTIDHGNNIKTRYGHMQMFVVHAGQFVHRYQLIGYMGNTGRSVGPHLHYEVWKNGAPVSPLAYMLPNEYTVD